MWQEILQNKEWIFSGIGTAILLGIATHFLSLARFVLLTGVKPLRYRRAYQTATVTAIKSAVERLYLCYSRLEGSSTGESHSKKFNKHMIDATKSGRLRSVVLLAQKPDRLPCAFEYATNNIEVFFSTDFQLFDLRYVIADSDVAVVGEKMTTGSNEKYTVSTRWHRLNSKAIVHLLRRNFEDAISDSKTATFDRYARYCAFKYRKERSYLSMPDSFWSSYLHPKFFEESHVPLILVAGCPGSGKSTFSRRLVDLLPNNTVLENIIHLPDYAFFEDQFEHVGKVDGIAERVGDGFLLRDAAHAFRQATEYLIAIIEAAKSSVNPPDVILAEIARERYDEDIKAFSDAKLRPDYVVYLSAPFETCLARNRIRRSSTEGDTHFVSEQEMKRTYSADNLERLRADFGECLLVLNNSDDGMKGVDDAVKSFTRIAIPKIIGTSESSSTT